MPNKMLIDATHPEETRVVVVRGNRVEEFDFETAQRKQLRGNIYLAKVTRVEPSLQAASVEYGGNRHGFLAFSEIHPDYYQIPMADRQALIEAEERAHREAEEENETRSNRRRSRHRSSRRRSSGERVRSDVVGSPDLAAPVEEGQDLGHPVEGQDTIPEAGAFTESHGFAESHDHDGDHAHDDRTHDLHFHDDHAHDDDEHDDHGHHDDEDRPHATDDHGTENHDHANHEHAQVVAKAEQDDHAAEQPQSVHADVVAAPAAEEPEVPVIADVAAPLPPPLPDAIAQADHHDEHHDDGHHHDDHAHDEHDHDAHDHHDHDAHHETGEVVAEHEGSETALVPHDDADVARHGDEAHPDEAHDDESHDDDEDGEDAEEEHVESVGGDDVLEEVPERTFRPRRQYKIQEVIKRRQVMLVQVVKEERGNKGAALTTYLSLAGRYAVLMPNTARGGGISRKITSAQDRSRLKEVVQDLDVPEGMGVILRTAGANRTKPEIKRDFEYLLRLWETVRDMTLKSQAPTLVYEEGSLIKRSLRDLYNKEIDDILVAGEAGYREAYDFMKMLMPSNVRAVKQYRDGQPLFSRMGVESQLDAMFTPTVQLRSGGYIVINQTEALVSIDVNSGRATREHHIEDTALKTNLEAAEEVARQLRLRDLAGLIVIDFIDMDEKRNNRAVERKLSDCLRQDRARIQVGRISHFGLLEMSRQRIRASVLESSTEPCPHCGGTGHVRSVSSVALQLLRSLEEALMKGATHNLVVRTRTEVALYVLNHKRGHLRDLEDSFKVTLAVIADPAVAGQQSFLIDRGEQVHTLEAAKALIAAQLSAAPLPVEEIEDEDEAFDAETESEVETEETEGLSDEATAEGGQADGERDGQRRKRRRRRRGRGGNEGRDGAPGEATDAAPPLDPDQAPDLQAHDQQGQDQHAQDLQAHDQQEDGEVDGEDADEQPAFTSGDQGDADANGERRPRRRGRRGGRRRRGGPEDGLAASISDELAPTPASEVEGAVADFDGGGVAHTIAADSDASVSETQPSEVIAPVSAPQPTAAVPEAPKAEEKAPRRSTVREKVSFGTQSKPDEALAAVAAPVETVSAGDAASASVTPSAEPAAIVPEPAAPESAAPETPAAPRKAGWWSRRFGGGE